MRSAAAPGGRQRRPTADSDAKRERILQAAQALFHAQGYAQGYAHTTMAQIVGVPGVTKPFVYYYFRNKQEIFEALSWRPTVACFTVLDFAASDSRPAHEKVQDGLQRLIRATIAHYPAAFFPYREPQCYRPEYLTRARAPSSPAARARRWSRPWCNRPRATTSASPARK